MSPVILALAFMAMGLALLAVEIAVIPGFGVVGGLGVLCLGYGSWVAWSSYGPVWGTLSFAASLGLTVVFFVGFMRSKTKERMVLQGSTDGQPSDLPSREASMVGKVGIAQTPLRPSGVISLEGERLTVVADDGAFIDKGTSVEVVKVDQNSVIVREHRGS